jgi:glycosyltransferase involved in cell wall biosynthesis
MRVDLRGHADVRMRIVYLCDAVIPSRSSNSMQIMRMCSAFEAVGHETMLLHPGYAVGDLEGWDGDLWRFYGVSPKFDVRTVGLPGAGRLRRFPRAALPLRAVGLGSWALARSRPGKLPFVAYARTPLGAVAAAVTRRMWTGRSACQAVVLEVHDAPRTALQRRALEATDAVVAISDALRRKLVDDVPRLADRILVEHDGVDFAAISPDRIDRRAARARLGLDARRSIVAYTGRAIHGKGVDVLLDAAARLPEMLVLVVGRVYEAAYERRARSLPNVVLTGFVPPAEVPNYLAAADVLVVPTTPDLAYAEYTSPLKLFEYMASGRPIVAADLPVLREVLRPGENALVYPPRDARSLADAARRIVSDSDLADALASRALKDVQPYAWERRASRIVERLSTLAPSVGRRSA